MSCVRLLPLAPFIIRASSAAVSASDHPRIITSTTLDGVKAAIVASGPSAGIGLRWQTAITQFATTSNWTPGTYCQVSTWWMALLCYMRKDSDLGLTWPAKSGSSTRATYVAATIARIDALIASGPTDKYIPIGVAGVYDFLYDDLTPLQRTTYNDFLEANTTSDYATGEAWNDQTALTHVAALMRDIACEDHAARYANALSATQIFCEARTWMGDALGHGYEWKDSYPTNVAQIMSMWLLRHYQPALTDVDTYDYYTYHLQEAAQMLRQMTIPHPGLQYPVPMKTNETAHATLYYRLGLVPAHILWAFETLPGRTYLTADDGIRQKITDNEADQATLANNEADLLSFLKYYWDEQTLGATTGNNRPLNFASGDGRWRDSPGPNTFACVIPWLILNTQPPATAKTGEAAGIPLTRRWWPGTLDYTTITNSHTIANSSRSLISYWHKRWFVQAYDGNAHFNGGWQAHRAGPLYGFGGVDSHSTVTRRQTRHHNGCFTFYDDSEWPEFQTVNNDDYDTGGVRMADTVSAGNHTQAEVATNDFGQVTKWWADADCVAISSDLTNSYANDTWNNTNNPSRIVSFTKDWICVRRGADGTTRDHIFSYDRIELKDSRFTPRLNINCCNDPDIDGTEAAHTPYTPPDQSVTLQDWEGLGPTRWDYTSPTRIRFDNLTSPGLTGGAPGSGATHSTLGDGKTITRILQPSSITMRKSGGSNAQVLGAPTVSYNGAPWFTINGAWIQGEGGWGRTDSSSGGIGATNKPAHLPYIGPYVVEVLPTAVSTSHRYLTVTDLMDGGDTITEAEYSELTCDANSVAARCAASAVSIAKTTAGRTSGSITLPVGVAFVVIQGLSASTSYTLAGTGGVSVVTASPATSSNTGVLSVDVSVASSGTLTFAEGSSASMTYLIGVGGVTDSVATIRAKTDQAASIAIEYSTSSSLAGSTTSSGVTTLADDDFTGEKQITGLSASTTYYYSVKVDGVRAHSAPFPYFKTAPAEGVATSFRFVPVSCQIGPYGPAMASVAGESPDFLVHLGDVIYGDSTDLDTLRHGPDTGGYTARGPGQKTYYGPLYPPETDWSTYIVRRMWRDHIWSDHEYFDNEDGDYANKATSLKAFKEYTVFHPLANPTQGVWHSFRYGHCEFFCTDGRYQREGGKVRFPATATELTPDTGSGGTTLVIPAAASPSAFPNFYRSYYVKFADGTVNRVTAYNQTTRALTMDGSMGVGTFHLRRASYFDMDMIASGQLDWLIDGLNNSTATFKFICLDTPFNPSATGFSDALPGWEAVDQMEINYIKQRVTAPAAAPVSANVVQSSIILLSGDRHMQAIDDGTNSYWPEGLSSRLAQDGTSTSGGWSQGTNLSTEGYLVVDVTPTTVTITGRKYDGTTLGTITPLTVNAV